jgi:chromate transporter
MNGGQVLAVFLRAAFLSVNGGTTLALLQEDLVQRLHVLSPSDFAVGVAVGAASPGPFGYGCIALGFLADGWRGAVVATLTSWLPAFLSIPLRAGYRRLEGRAWLAGMTWGVAATGTGLLVSLALSLTLQSLAGWREAVIGAVALALLSRRLPAPVILALTGAAGALLLK